MDASAPPSVGFGDPTHFCFACNCAVLVVPFTDHSSDPSTATASECYPICGQCRAACVITLADAIADGMVVDETPVPDTLGHRSSSASDDPDVPNTSTTPGPDSPVGSDVAATVVQAVNQTHHTSFADMIQSVMQIVMPILGGVSGVSQPPQQPSQSPSPMHQPPYQSGSSNSTRTTTTSGESVRPPQNGVAGPFEFLNSLGNLFGGVGDVTVDVSLVPMNRNLQANAGGGGNGGGGGGGFTSFSQMFPFPFPFMGPGNISTASIGGGGGGGGGGSFTIGDYAVGNIDNLLSQLMNAYSGRIGTPPAAAAAINDLASIEVTDPHRFTPAECTICQDEFRVGDRLNQLPCAHAFHPDCIVPWLRMHNSCPICRDQSIPTDDPDYEARRRQQQQQQQQQRRNQNQNRNQNQGTGSRRPNGDRDGDGDGNGYSPPSGYPSYFS